MKSLKTKSKASGHTAPTPYGMGDYYGTGIKAPLGKIREGTVGYQPVSPQKMGKPPKKLA